MATSKKGRGGVTLAIQANKPPRSPRRQSGSEMAIHLRNVPPGYDWGWFSREDARMHLQPVDQKHRTADYKVWLEERGRRVFQPEGSIPPKVLKRVEGELVKHRKRIEDDWTRLMLQKDWLILSLTGSIITVVAYPQVPGSGFARTLDLADYLPGIYHPESQLVAREKKPVTPEEIALSKELCAIEIYPQREEGRRHHIYLPPILWQD